MSDRVTLTDYEARRLLNAIVKEFVQMTAEELEQQATEGNRYGTSGMEPLWGIFKGRTCRFFLISTEPRLFRVPLMFRQAEVLMPRNKGFSVVTLLMHG